MAGLGDLLGKGLRILGVAPKDFCRDRLAVLIAQQADDNLLFTPLAVAIVAVGAILVLLAFQIAAGHVIEKQLRLLLSMAGGKESLFNLNLVLTEPAEIFIEIVLIKSAADAKHVASGMDFSQAHRRKSRALI